MGMGPLPATEKALSKAGISMDQIAAKTLGKATQLPSLELALESVDAAATCDDGSCIYVGTISWAGPTYPLTMESDPAAAFERLFGDDTSDPTARRIRAERKGSILDSVLEEVAELKREVGPGDQSRLTGYLESLRAVELRIQKSIEQNVDLPAVDRPTGGPSTFEEHAKFNPIHNDKTKNIKNGRTKIMKTALNGFE